MKKIILFSLILIAIGFTQYTKAQGALSGSSVITTGTVLDGEDRQQLPTYI